MNSTMQRRLALVGLTMLAGAAISVSGGTAASAATVAAPHHGTVVTANPGHGDLRTRPARWVRVGDFDNMRECRHAGVRGERYRAWNTFLCVRDEHARGDWDRSHGRGSWDRRHHNQYTLWVQRAHRGWHR